jgi:hypothetical protein
MEETCDEYGKIELNPEEVYLGGIKGGKKHGLGLILNSVTRKTAYGNFVENKKHGRFLESGQYCATKRVFYSNDLPSSEESFREQVS